MTQPLRASQVKAEKIEYRWEGRIPKGMITVVAGRPDQGKGLFATRVAADVSAGGETVLYSAHEDSHKLMTRPRLEAAGADLDLVRLWRFRLPEHEYELAEIVHKRNIGLIVMDPLAAHLSHGISRHSDNIRKMLAPLTQLVESTGASVLIIEHALKRVSKSGHVLDCIGGSGSGLIAAARAAFVFGRDPDEEDRRVLAPAKFNIDAMPNSLAFELDTEEIEMKTKQGEAFVQEAPYLLADEELDVFNPMRLFEIKHQPGRGRPSDKRSSAAEWLTTYLAEEGATPLKTIEEDAKQVNMSRRTLQRAASDMGIVKNGNTRNITWDLPDEVKDAMGLPKGQPAPQPASGDEPPAVPGQTSITDEDLEKLLDGGDADA